MTPKEAAFVRAYLQEREGKKAAIAAGYAPRRAKQAGSELLKRAHIKAAIEAAETRVTVQVEQQVAVDRAWVINKLVEQHAINAKPIAILDGEGNEIGEKQANPSAANKALQLIGRAIGMFDKPDTGKEDWNKYSDDELRARLAKNISEIGGIGFIEMLMLPPPKGPAN